MSNRKTILLYTDESTAGGVAHYNDSLLPELLAAGWRVFSAQPPNDSPMLPKQRELGIVQRFLSYEPRIAFARSFTDTDDPERIMEEIRPQLVYFSDCCPISNIAAKHVALRRQVPFVSICHSGADYLAQRFPACLPVVKRQFAMAAEVLAISAKNLDILRTHFGLAPDKGVVVPNGRPASFFAPPDPEVRRRLRAEIGLPADGVLCFTSARFDAAKGYQHQLAAIQRLQSRAQLGSLYFAWAGTGELHGRFAELIQAGSLKNRIRLLGQRWDVAAWLDAADIFVLTTMLEGGLPLSVMEAMAKGLPTVVTAVSGIAEVAKGASRLLPDPNTNPEQTATALAQALLELGRDSLQRANLGRAGRSLAEREFRLEQNVQRTLALLEAAAGPADSNAAAARSAPVAAGTPATAEAPPIRVSAIVAMAPGDEQAVATLAALTSQTLFFQRQLEVIVVDLGLSEGERQSLQNRQTPSGQLVLVQVAEGGRRHAGWNQALGVARGKYCTCLDGGTRPRPNALELMALALQEKTDIALVYADVEIEGSARGAADDRPTAPVLRLPDFFPPSALLYDPFGPLRLWRRAVHERIGAFDERLTATCEHDFSLRFAREFGAIHLPAVLGSSKAPAPAVAETLTQTEQAALWESYRTASMIETLYARAGMPAGTAAENALLHLDLGVRAWRHFPPAALGAAVADPGFAVHCFRRATELDPSLAAAFNNLLCLVATTGPAAELASLLEHAPAAAAGTVLGNNLARLKLAPADQQTIAALELMAAPLGLPSEGELDGRLEPAGLPA